jgi:hypothetical protein
METGIGPQALAERARAAGILAYRDGGRVIVRDDARDDVRAAALSFLDVLATATGRSTFYNTAEEQQAAEAAAHDAVRAVNRGLYGAMLALPGVQDRAVQAGLQWLLDNPGTGEAHSFIGPDEEGRLLGRLCRRLPPTRMLKMFASFRAARVNNARTRKLILRSVLGAGRRLPLWAVKYRDKLREALRHALGTGVAAGVAKMCAALDPRASGSAHMAKHIDRHLSPALPKDHAYQCLAFILGAEREGGFTVPLLAARMAARGDLAAGAKLPVEVLFGIRSTHHRGTDKKAVLELAKGAGTLSAGQELAMQKSARRAGVELGLDATRQGLVGLYVLALEEGGMSEDTRLTMDTHARIAAAGLPMRHERVGIVLDASESMAGTAQQKWRPMALALAMRDVLAATASVEASVECENAADAQGLVRPAGGTSLASLLLRALRKQPDAVYVLTDGYENAPAGRLDEVLRRARALGVRTPVYQLTPVMGAEAAGVRSLSGEMAVLPVSRPESLGLSMVRAALSQSVEAGIAGLLELAAPMLRPMLAEVRDTLPADAEEAGQAG